MNSEVNQDHQSLQSSVLNNFFFFIEIPLIAFISIYLDIPILRQILGFISLTFIPGVFVLINLKACDLSLTRVILYSIGLSIGLVMFIGLGINILLPYLGVTKPISTIWLAGIINLFNFILGISAYLRNRYFFSVQLANNESTEKSTIISILLFLILIVILAILGAFFVTFRQNNIVLLILIPLVAILVVLIGLNKSIPSRVYPISIISIALALLFQQTLITPYLTGYDIHAEYYYQSLVLINGHWDFSIGNNINSMLSITMLGPIYSIFLNIDSIWILKIVYPMLFSLVPLTLFEIFKDYLDSKQAFLASFFFMSMMVFFTEMTALARQQIAELFFTLIILLIVEKQLTSTKKTALIIIFAISLVVSHYGLTYVAIALFGFGWLLLLISRNQTVRRCYEFIGGKLTGAKLNLQAGTSFLSKPWNRPMLCGQFIGFFIISSLTWYMFTSSGAPFNSIVNIGHSLYADLVKFNSSNVRESLVGTAAGLDFSQVPSLGKAFRIIQYLIELFILVGLLKLMLNLRRYKINSEYAALIPGAALILFACITIPYFSSFLNITRFYHISLLLLAPLFILGAESLWSWLVRTLRLLFSKAGQELLKPIYSSLIVLLILIPYYFFNTGFIFEITKSEYIKSNIPSTMALSNYRVDFINYDWREAAAALWLTVYPKEVKIYSDEYGQLILRDFIYGKEERFPLDNQSIQDNSYIYLRKWNIYEKKLALLVINGALTQTQEVNINDVPEIANIINNSNLLYNNGGAEILGSK